MITAEELLLLANIGLLLALILPILYFSRRFRSLSRLLDELHLDIPANSGELRVQVWISNDRERRRFWKLAPATHVGILVLGPERIVLHASNLKGERFIQQFDRTGLQVEWIGNQRMRDSNLQWLALHHGGERLYLSAYTGLIALPSRQQTAEIYRNLAGQHAKFPGTQEFALEKNRASVAVLALMALLAIYALADGVFLNPLEVVGYPSSRFLLPVLPFALIGGCAVAIYLFLLRASVPARETLVLTMLCVLALTAAALPAAKRLDTALAGTPMQLRDYRMVKEGLFEPVASGLPRLDLRLRCDYWQQFEAEHPFQFSLQQGGLGLWQFDGRALDREIAAYLKTHPQCRK